MDGDLQVGIIRFHSRQWVFVMHSDAFMQSRLFHV